MSSSVSMVTLESHSFEFASKTSASVGKIVHKCLRNSVKVKASQEKLDKDIPASSTVSKSPCAVRLCIASVDVCL